MEDRSNAQLTTDDNSTTEPHGVSVTNDTSATAPNEIPGNQARPQSSMGVIQPELKSAAGESEATLSKTPRSFTRYQWGIIAVLAAINFTHILDFVIVMPLGDQLRQQLQISPRQFGVIVSAYGLTAMIVGIMSSSVVDRFDRKTVLVGSFIGFTAATFYCGLAGDYLHLVIARSLTGLFGGLAASSVMAVIGDVFSDGQRGRAIGVVTSAFAVASTIGLPVGLWLSIRYGTWNAPFIAIGILATVVLIAAAIFLPSLTSHRSATLSNPLWQLAAVVRHPNHLWSYAFMMCTIFGTFLIVPFIAPYLQANCGRTAADLPIIYAIAGMCTLVSMNVVGWATDRFGARPLFLLCAGGAVALTLVITNLRWVSLPMAVLVTTAFMVLASGRIIPAQTMMLRASDPKLRGAFMNLNTAVSHFATAVGPLVTGSIVGELFPGGPLTGYSTAGFIAALFGVCALLLSFRLQSRHTGQ